MADRYWVGGTGSWTDATKWSTVSGGAGGSLVSDGDNVYIDGNSDAGGPFEIRLSKGSAQTAIFNVSSSLSFTLSLNLRQSLTVTTSFKVESPLVDIRGTIVNVSSIILRFDGIPDNGTITYACAVPIQNIGLTLINVKLKNNVDIRHVAGFTNTRIYEIRKNFWSNSFNYSLGPTVQSTFTFNNNLLSLTESVVVDISNCIFNFGTLITNNWFFGDKTKLISTNSEISLSGSDCGLNFYFGDKRVDPYWTLPRISFRHSGLIQNYSGAGISFVPIAASGLTTLTTINIPKLSIQKGGIALTTPGDYIFALNSSGLPRNFTRIVINELAISATALNRIVLAPSQNVLGVTNPFKVFLNSASLKQVIFAGIEIEGFRELSVSFSNSFIGVCNWGVPCRNIKVPQPKTVYWNNPAGGNYFSNSFTSISGGTVALSSFPFPQDTWLLTDQGLNSSATISFPRSLATFLPEFNSSLRTLPMYFYHVGEPTGVGLRSIYCDKSYLSNNNVGYVITASSTNTTLVDLFLTGTGTFSLANPTSWFVSFCPNANYKITSPLNFEISRFGIYNSTIDFNSNTLNVKTGILYFKDGLALNIPSTVIFQDSFEIDTPYPNTDFICRPNNNLTPAKSLVIYQQQSSPQTSSLQSAVKINSLILDGTSTGRSFSYSLRLRGSLILNNLIYSKIGNVSVGFDQSFDYTIKNFKLQGIANGAVTASIALVNTSIISETVTITYSGLDFAESLSFVHFGTRVKIAPTGRVFAGTRSTTDVANNGVIYTDRPRITDVNAGGDVTSNSVIKINTNVTAGFAPVFSAKYKDVTITDLSLNNSTTYIATFPNYFANNIKVGAKHELKIIRGN